MLQRKPRHSQPLESARERLEAPIPRLCETGIPAGSSFGSGDSSSNSSSIFPTFPVIRGNPSSVCFRNFPFGSTTSHAFPSFLPAFPRTLLPSSAAPSWAGGLDRFFQILGMGELWSCSELRTLFPGVIPRGHSQRLFPGVIPSPWLRSQLSSEDQSLATTPRSRRIFPENSPFFSLSPPHLGIPKVGSENPAGSAFKLVPKSQKNSKSGDVQTKNFQEKSGIVP